MGYSSWTPAFRQGIISRMDAGESPRQIADDLDLKRTDIQALYNDFQKKGRVSQINPAVIISPQYEGYTVVNINIEDKKHQDAFVNKDHYYIDHPEVFDPRVIANFEITKNIKLMRNPHTNNPLYQRVFTDNAIYWDQGKKIFKISRPYTPEIIDNTTFPDYQITVNQFGIVETYIKLKETK